MDCQEVIGGGVVSREAAVNKDSQASQVKFPTLLPRKGSQGKVSKIAKVAKVTLRRFLRSSRIKFPK